MSRHIEKETRVMISQEEYVSICSDIFKSNPYAQYVNQTNYYFDTDDFEFSNNHQVVRIREKSHMYELTVKIKGEDGDIEINQNISDKLAHKYLRNGSLPHGEVYNAVAALGISPKKLKVIASCYTRRIDVKYDDYLLVIDMNRYDDIEDYNIEIESDISVAHAREVLKRYCEQYQLTYQEDYLVKSARAIKHAREKLASA